MIESRLLYAAGTWDELPESLAARISTVRLKPFRTIYKMHNYGGRAITDVEVLRESRRPPLLALLRAHRLRYAARVVRSAPRLLVALVQAVREWTLRLRDDMAVI